MSWNDVCCSSWVKNVCLSIFCRVATLALGQPYGCPSASAVTLQDMITAYIMPQQTKQSGDYVYDTWNILLGCNFDGIYSKDAVFIEDNVRMQF